MFGALKKSIRDTGLSDAFLGSALSTSARVGSSVNAFLCSVVRVGSILRNLLLLDPKVCRFASRRSPQR